MIKNNTWITNRSLVFFIIISVILFLFYSTLKKENYENSDESYTYNPDGSRKSFSPKDAKEACQVISSRAEEIEAEWDGQANVIKEISKNNPYGFLNPQNYKSGDNVQKTITRNIITNDLSSEDITKIKESCVSISTSTQKNIINVNVNDCPYCLKTLDLKAQLISQGKDPNLIQGCEVRNINQINSSKSLQTCQIQTAIEVLREKKNSIDSQALAEVLQKAQGALSGSNKSSTMNCNVVSTDMSSYNYFEKISECNNTFKADQENRVEGCAGFQNIIQGNYADSYQSCVLETDQQIEEKQESETKAITTTKVSQTTEGINTTASIISLIICCCSCCILLSLLAAAGSKSDKIKTQLNQFK